jgi:hypothetical protein
MSANITQAAYERNDNNIQGLSLETYIRSKTEGSCGDYTLITITTGIVLTWHNDKGRAAALKFLKSENVPSGYIAQIGKFQGMVGVAIHIPIK